VLRWSLRISLAFVVYALVVLASYRAMTYSGSIWGVRLFVAATVLAPAPICFALLLTWLRPEPRWSLRTWTAFVAYVAVDMASAATFAKTDSHVAGLTFTFLNIFPVSAFVIALIVRRVRRDLHDPKTLY
jgi:hypothetical protein